MTEATHASRHKKKENALIDLILEHDIVAVQESHGSEQRWVSFSNNPKVKQMNVTCEYRSTNDRIGGVAFFIKQELLNQASVTAHFEEIVDLEGYLYQNAISRRLHFCH